MPTNQEAARTLGASRLTVQKAYERLAKEGRVTRVRKKGTFAGERGDVLDLWRNNRLPAPTVAQSLAQEIRGGIYPFGSPIASYDILSRRFHVSKGKVKSGLQSLLEQGLIHRRGKGFAAGAGEVSWNSLTNTCLITVASSQNSYLAALNSELVSPFYHTLYRELQKSSVPLLTYFLSPGKDGKPGGAELAALKRFISGRKQRVLGLVAIPPNGAEPMANFLSALDTIGMLFVGCQHEAQPAPTGQLRNGIRFYSRHDDICACLVRSLAALGHRKAAFVSRYHPPWVLARYQCLSQWATRLIPGGELHLFPRDNINGESHHWSPADYNIWLRSIRRPWPTFAGKILNRWDNWDAMGPDARFMLSFAAPLANLEHHSQVTAFIFANDSMAGLYEQAWRRVGIRMPEDFSLFAVDNIPSSFANISSTVDRGLGNSGFTAARLFLRDLPLSIKKGDAVASEPFFVPRLGIGPPRKGSARLPKGFQNILMHR